MLQSSLEHDGAIPFGRSVCAATEFLVDVPAIQPQIETPSSENEDDGSPAAVPFPIAIIGMAMRLPGGVTNEAEFWDFLVNKRDGHCRVPADRYNIDAFYHKDGLPGTIRTEHGYFLQQDISQVDISFFGMTKVEASKLDPQQRLLLEVVWECMENAGQRDWRGTNVGCYVGSFGEDWLDLASKDTLAIDRYRVMSAGDFALANNVSYQYDLRGPSVVFRTGCSSSMVALHEACQALYSGECSSALVAGTNLIMTPTMTTTMSDNMVLSPSGICKTFDDAADGYGRGEAINAILIKPLDAALRDGDAIRAVIRSTSVNCDGKTSSITTPGSQAQERLIRNAYRKAGVEDIGKTAFFECHGTGTIVGDTAETSVVAKIFGNDGIYMGAVKPNVGHSEGASGITSVIKCVLALENKTIPPNVYFEQPNAKIPFEQAKLQVPTEATPWPSDRHERVSVNSFGIGGTNAHLIMESAASVLGNQSEDEIEPSPTREMAHLLIHSAKTPTSLEANIQTIDVYHKAHEAADSDLAYTLAFRREQLTHRAFSIIGTDGALQTCARARATNPNIVYVFSGQGAQWPGMGRELIYKSVRFRDDIRDLDKHLQRLTNSPSWTIENELLKCDHASRMSEARLSQPLCTAIQVALVNLLREWGVTPSLVVGHSSGEIAAAYASGAISAETAIAIAYNRGQAVDAVRTPGAMAAVGLGAEEAKPFIREGVVVACENSPRSVTLSGDKEILEDIICELEVEEIFCRRLAVNVAYHSHHMKAIGETFEQMLPNMEFNATMIPLYSTVIGEIITKPDQLTAAYWRQNLESPVLFSTAVQDLLKASSGTHTIVEIGPHSVLEAPLRHIFAQVDEKKRPEYTPTLVRAKEPWTCLLRTVGHLYITGIPVDLTGVIPRAKTLTNLPPYQWTHDERFWSETRMAQDWRLRRSRHHELLGSRTLDSTNLEPIWRNLLQLDNALWLLDHRISGEVVFPCAGYVAMVGEATRQISDRDDYTIRNLFIRTALILSSTEFSGIELITCLRPLKLADNVDSHCYEFTISSYQNETWTKHCVGQVRPGSLREHPESSIHPYLREVSPEKWYAALHAHGLEYGDHFRGLRKITASPSSSHAAAELRDTEAYYVSDYALHPILIDQCLQLLSVAATQGVSRRMTRLCIPTAIQDLYVAHARDTMQLDVSCDMTGGMMTGEALLTCQNRVVLSMQRATFFGISESALEDTQAPLLSTVEWKPHVNFTPVDILLPPIEKGLFPGKVMAELVGLFIVETYHRTRSASPKQDHLKKYLSWIEKTYFQICDDKATLVPEMRDKFVHNPTARLPYLEATLSNPHHPLLAAPFELGERILSSINDLLEDKVNPLDLLMKDDGLQRLYGHMPSITEWEKYLAALAFSKPALRILEVGGGTGGTTSLALAGLCSTSGPGKGRMYTSYTFTDISAGFIAPAREKFKQYFGMHYATLDISKDPVEQGFESGSYDLVIASNVLHATPNITSSLRNIRKLLAPEGRFLLQELSHDVPLFDYIMGILPGWWLADDGRERPYLSPEEWHKALLETGFTGTDVVRLDNEAPYHVNANILSSVPAPEENCAGIISLLYNGKIPEWARQLESQLLSRGWDVRWLALGDKPAESTDVISLLDLDDPFLHNIAREDFEAFQKSIISLRGHLLWLTKPTHALYGQTPDPRYALTLGLMRVLCQDIEIKAITIELNQCDMDALRAVLDVLSSAKAHKEDSLHEADSEFALHDGLLHVPRFGWHSTENTVSSIQSCLPRAMDVKCFGILDSITWQFTDRSRKLAAHEVEVEVKYVGLNFRDVMISMGLMGATDQVGIEGSGIVRKVGSSVTTLQVGQEVVLSGMGLMCTRKILPADSCYPLPGNMSLAEAAATPCIFLTAIYSLITMANVQRGQSVLIHSACGGVGLAAIQICQMLGAEIYVTAGSPEKKQYLMDNYGIPEENMFDSRSMSFVSGIMKRTNNRGVDVVLNSLAGELLHASWRCVAEYGKMVELGKRDFLGHGKLEMDMFGGNRAFFGVDLFKLGMERPEIVRETVSKQMKLLQEGKLHPIRSLNLFDATDIVKAFRYMQTGQHIGKIVIRMPDDPSVLQVTGAHASSALFRSDVAYLLVGGLGGIGRAVATWMVERGARHFVFVSRSGSDTPKAKVFIKDLEAQAECEVMIIQGSVANLEDVQRAVKCASRPIGGVIQLSMVLQDQQFNQMTHTEWTTALAPKVDGTWNLHQVTKDLPLDFFILFSSISGLCGMTGQANYAAANTYLDAFVHFRRAQNLPAHVLDLGFMGDIGYIPEKSQRTLELNRSLRMQVLSERDLLQVLELAILGGPSQIALGLSTTASSSEASAKPWWARDARFAAWNHLSTTGGPVSDGGQEDELRRFLAEVDEDPSILDDPATHDRLTFELGKMIASHMSYSGDMSLEELAKISIDSLMAIEIRSWFRRHVKIEISLLEIANAGTVGGLSKTTVKILKTKYASEELKPGDAVAMLDASHVQIDEVALCRQDCELGRDIHPIATAAPEWHIPTEGHVFFTGATGFLGAYLLCMLASLPHVKQVACLVRAPNEQVGLDRIKRTLQDYGLPLDYEAKVKAIPGDLANPQLGLGTKQYKELAEWASVVFHLAAAVDYTLPYSFHREANILGLYHMLQFANTGRLKALHYTSTISAWGAACHISGELVPEDARPSFDPDEQDQHIGYTRSKAVAEQVIWNAISNGLPISIYRPGYVTGHSVTGRTKASDMMNYLMSTCIRIRAYPAAPRLRNQFAPVDFCCSALLRLALSPASLGHAYNLVRPDQNQTVTFEETFTLLSQLCLSPLRCLPPSEWVEEFGRHADSRLKSSSSMVADAMKEYMRFWTVGTGALAYIETHNLQEALKESPELLAVPSMPELMKTYFPIWAPQEQKLT
ncbi:polyketide synthase [Aspergillus homomorphus CBS 101889]|uniref:Polyketide synthase n=1 Tax=Aspergillus homomorphus (strain CBS 101889) TaxID=1450537 RepID=A0A395I2K5_ASPHC|nr:polyketide synthase [Aspergillus homomorphus CBS 101889]RAL13936.1 polyketide synthase [Aspergillus homomorphus CBS 101889]